MSEQNRIKNTPIIKVDVRIEPNHDGSHILWCVSCSDGTKSSGFAKNAPDAIRDSALFVEAMLQPRIGGIFKKTKIREVTNGD